jgi:hypothetical protein
MKFGSYHKSKAILEGTAPFSSDIVNKKWSLSEEYSYHLLLFQQVITISKNLFLNNTLVDEV